MLTLREISNELLELQVCTSERAVGKLFGRSESWCSSTIARKRDVSVDALLRFSLHLDRMMESTLNAIGVENDPDEKSALQEGHQALASLKQSVMAEVWGRVSMES